MAERDPENDWRYVDVVRAVEVAKGDVVDVYGSLFDVPDGHARPGRTVTGRARGRGGVCWRLVDGSTVWVRAEALVFRGRFQVRT